MNFSTHKSILINAIESKKIQCWSETDELKGVIICPPSTFSPRSTDDLLINGFNQFTSYEKLFDCYSEFSHILASNGVDVYELTKFIYPNQTISFNDCVNRIFVRDIGAAIGNTFVMGKAALIARKNEFHIATTALDNFFDTNIEKIDKTFEFGDMIFIDSKCIMFNYGSRSKFESIHNLIDISLSQGISTAIVFNIPSSYNIIHLDLMINVIKNGVCIADQRLALLNVSLYIDGQLHSINMFKYIAANLGIHIYWVDNIQSFAFNFLSINNETILISCEYKHIFSDILKKNKINAIPLNTVELEKAGGSVRCATLPFCRQS